MQIQVGHKIIGDNASPFIIAEAGVNHNGSFELACELIKEAARIGADCIKFQTFKADKLVHEYSPKPEYQIANTGKEESQYAMLKRLEMPLEWYEPLIHLCQEKGILFLSTPYDIEDIKFLQQFDICAYKVPSALLVEPDYLRYMAIMDKPIFLSTGMCTLADVAKAVDIIKATGNENIILLQCTTNYPSRLEDCNLRAISLFRDTFQLLSGYSDHTQGSLAAIVAVGLGACVIERHFTLDKNFAGPDHSSSSTPAEMQELIEALHNIPLLLGHRQKKHIHAELKNKTAMRRSICAAKDIEKGTIISPAHLNFSRPATGLPPHCAQDIIGTIAQKNISKNTLITYDDFMHPVKKIVECVRICKEHYQELLDIFNEIMRTPDIEQMFNPHAFTEEQAEKICSYTGKDTYVLLKAENAIVGYGMLRGFDEGFSIPSLGIYIKERYRKSFWATVCMQALHNVAYELGINTIRLTVFPKNYAARFLYARMGYEVAERTAQKITMHIHL